MYKICIDPGHGGTERANKGPTGYVEADGVLAIAKYLKRELLATEKFDVLLTRENDITLGLTERATKAVDFRADLMISEHSNASGLIVNDKVRGTCVYYSVDIPEDKIFAGNISEAVAVALGIPNHGAKTHESERYPGEDYYTVIDASQDRGIPHVILVESAFHDNREDEALLKDEDNLKKIAKAQAKVICKYFNVTYKDPDKIEKPIEKKVKPTLKKGLYDNPHVRELQRILKEFGYEITVDGDFGIGTENLVKDFQKACGTLDVDGIVGPKTWELLYLLKSKDLNGTNKRSIASKIKKLLKKVKGDK